MSLPPDRALSIVERMAACSKTPEDRAAYLVSLENMYRRNKDEEMLEAVARYRLAQQMK